MAGADPEEPVASPLLRQRWDSASFLHWRYPAPDVARLLPGWATVEEIDGSAWVGMVPFVAVGTRLSWLASTVSLPPFPETNLRTYVRTPSGTTAVWFFSLEAASVAVVAAARSALGVPYRWATMTAERTDGRCRYVSRRRRAGVGHRIEVRPGAPVDAGELRPRDHLLTGRWRAVIPRGRGRLVVPVRHEPWPLHRAELVDLEEDLLPAAGLPAPSSEPEVLWSPGVEAALGLPRRS